MSIELPKDAGGHEIPLDTKILYTEDGKRLDVNRFTYSVVQTIPDLKWGVVFMDCQYDYCSSFYLTPPEPPDSWEKLLEDLDKGEDICDYFEECPAEMYGKSCSDCKKAALKNIASRIRKLRGADE